MAQAWGKPANWGKTSERPPPINLDEFEVKWDRILVDERDFDTAIYRYSRFVRSDLGEGGREIWGGVLPCSRSWKRLEA